MPDSRPTPEPIAPLIHQIQTQIDSAGGCLPFDQFMAMALYQPGLGYYANRSRKFGYMPASGSDFVTAPELSPLFGACLARQVRQALLACVSNTVFEFGAGTGALAAQLLGELGDVVSHYCIIDLSGELRARQADSLAKWGDKVQWLDAWPQPMQGVVLGNEVLDAMPVKLLRWDGVEWFERGVTWQEQGFAWLDRPCSAPTHIDAELLASLLPDTVIEVHEQAQAFVASLGEHLTCGAVFLIDYGFEEKQYYHPQRIGGTLMCHQAHRADDNPLIDVGSKDITAHVNFTGIALAAQDVGFDVLGYTSQAHFLFNSGLADLLEQADLRQRAMAQKLVTEHEMGELFKVIGLAKGCAFDALGFANGDRSHRL